MLGSSSEQVMAAEAASVRLYEHDGTETAAVLFSSSGQVEDHQRNISKEVDEGHDDDDHRNNGGGRGGGGNRWPRQETLALLKIRSQMDATFRDSSFKAPLWQDVSRKLGELGYQRSAKKCKEKFENVYKYHRRTKEGRSGKPEGKTYRFFDQLEAFNNNQNNHHSSAIPPKTQAVLWTNNSQTVPPATDPIIHSSTNNFVQLPPQIHSSQDNINGFLPPNLTTKLFPSSTSSSTASDEEFQHQHKKNRKWKYFFRRLTKEVLRKQEKLQQSFLEAIANCDEERTAKEEAWRMQETARIEREHEILAHERSTAAAKDAAFIQFLHKVSLQQNSPEINNDVLLVPQAASSQVLPLSWATDHRSLITRSHHSAPRSLEARKLVCNNNGESNSIGAGSSRWPKAEVEALINLRTCLDVKYQESGPKGSLWEEISTGMKRLGYNRSSKRCKEKWENINKYFKKVKESSKRRPEDSKTCPYFHQLEALYKEKNNKNVDYHRPSIIIRDHNVIAFNGEKLPIMLPSSENMNPNQVEDEQYHGEHGESTEEDQDQVDDHDDDDDLHGQREIIKNYQASTMEIDGRIIMSDRDSSIKTVITN